MPSPLLLLLLLLAISSFPENRHLFAAADAALIQKTCKATKHYDLCVSSLSSDPASQTSDAKGLALIMISVGVANSTATSAYLSSQLPAAAAPAASTAAGKMLKVCAEKYGYAAAALQAAAQDLATADGIDYAYMHVSAAADYPNSCRNGFRRNPKLSYPPELARGEDALKRICDVVLGIIDNLGW